MRRTASGSYSRRKTLLLLVPLVFCALLVGEKWRGERALKQWKIAMRAKGEVLELAELLPKVSPESIEFSNQFSHAFEQLPRHLAAYCSVSGIIPKEPGTARRGSQEAQPVAAPAGAIINSWPDLDKALEQGDQALKAIRDLLKNPIPTMGYRKALEEDPDLPPNFVGFRISAQALHAAVINDVHKRDLAHAAENLSALLSFKKLNAEDPTFVSLMIRIAIMGLGVDACWDALQEKGWSDDQLAALQRACEGDAEVLAQLPRALEMERVARHYRLNWFRSHSYGAIVTRYGEMYKSFGWCIPAHEVGWPSLYRRWVFHPLWRVAWADQEELLYSEQLQLELQALRDATRRGSWVELEEQLDSIHARYRSPTASWRFYGKLPLAETFPGDSLDPKTKVALYPCADFSKAWFTCLKNLTLNEMALTVMAIKRYELAQGQPPPALSSLLPKFLAAIPRDFMNAQTLKYRLRPDGSFLLYSQGQDGKDQQGDPRPELTGKNPAFADAWQGRDWVWPQAAMQSKPSDD